MSEELDKFCVCANCGSEFTTAKVTGRKPKYCNTDKCNKDRANNRQKKYAIDNVYPEIVSDAVFISTLYHCARNRDEAAEFLEAIYNMAHEGKLSNRLRKLFTCTRLSQNKEKSDSAFADLCFPFDNYQIGLKNIVAIFYAFCKKEKGISPMELFKAGCAKWDKVTVRSDEIDYDFKSGFKRLEELPAFRSAMKHKINTMLKADATPATSEYQKHLKRKNAEAQIRAKYAANLVDFCHTATTTQAPALPIIIEAPVAPVAVPVEPILAAIVSEDEWEAALEARLAKMQAKASVAVSLVEDTSHKPEPKQEVFHPALQPAFDYDDFDETEFFNSAMR